ncbi:MAG: flagellar assembly peptidoglycan hydrolase FlgJ [Gammaproteobacteria bacterium]
MIDPSSMATHALNQITHALPSVSATATQDPEALREVAEQFEGLFLQMMLKSMRNASLGDGLLDSTHSKTYQDLYDKEIATEISKGQGLGLADVLVQQLSRMQSVDSDAASGALIQLDTKATDEAIIKTGSASPFVQSGETQQADWSPDSPEKFIKDLWPHARDAARKLGTSPEVLIAQSALETGWGKSMIQQADGNNSFNFFGIKANTAWQGDRAVSQTLEFENGAMQQRRDSFRAYTSVKESFDDYVHFLQQNPRYHQVLQSGGNTDRYIQSLQDAGYATDPEYASKIQRIISGPELQSMITEIKNSSSLPIS